MASLVQRDRREPHGRRAITGASNFAFLFLVLSGIYLWLPRAFKWAAFKTRLKLNPRAESGKARDFNWHHVFGIWSALPLAVIVASAVVFSYPWANDLVYRSVGEAPPQRGARGGASATGSQSTGQQARSWIRFLHTGEALGIVGQTVAGVVSLASTVMVWTGLALAYRRLIAPLLTRSRQRRASAA
ncbi:MAG TPA: PepSY-associated TM helix domain-containing protein [Gammaproteobacteria bacterium]|nr:PepSY-associated TM helix domain-containing protein [Gammaproteobacteria bacterium]